MNKPKLIKETIIWEEREQSINLQQHSLSNLNNRIIERKMFTLSIQKIISFMDKMSFHEKLIKQEKWKEKGDKVREYRRKSGYNIREIRKSE